NKSGIQVPFGSSDVKALLSMHEAYNYKGQKFAFAGRRCRVNGKVEGEGSDRDRPEHRNFPSPELAESPDCRDVNAGACQVINSNMLGKMSEGYVADIDRFNDVWNQPVVGYTSTVIGDEHVNSTHLSQGINGRVRIKLEMAYGEELKFYTPE